MYSRNLPGAQLTKHHLTGLSIRKFRERIYSKGRKNSMKNGRKNRIKNRTKNRNRRDERKRQAALITAIFMMAAMLLAGCASNGAGNEAKNYSAENRSDEGAAGNLEVHFLDVGQGDCTLIESQGHYMLIDAGDNNKGTLVQSYLESQGVEQLDYLIGTHPDSDHIGGLDVILTKFDVDTVMMPDVENDTRTYDDVIQAMKYRNLTNTVPHVGEVYSLGEAQFTIVAPAGSDYGDNTNDYSVGLILQHGENRFLFTGDAEEAAEQDILETGIDISADVYKAAHHGSRTAAYEPFLDAVDPEYAVISCGEGNSYGHPHAETMNWFRQNGVQVFRTDEDGTIIAVSDGTEITWNMSPNESWSTGEQSQSDKETLNAGQSVQGEKGADGIADSSASSLTGSSTGSPAAEDTYVLNTNTMKFHRPDCSSVKAMSDKNKETVSGDREALIQEGYSPCGNCNP